MVSKLMKVMNQINTVKSYLVDPASEASTDKAMIVFIHPKSGRTEIPCQFNPESLVIQKKAHWAGMKQADRDAPQLIFGGGHPATFTLDLFFDTTTLGNADVRMFTNSLLRLTLRGAGIPNPGDECPPRVQLIWGTFQLFEAVMRSIEIRYTLFLKNGTPVRARAHATFLQFSQDMEGTNPTSRTDPRKTYVVQQGDRLDYIAYCELGQASRWRDIAEANELENPEDLRPGQVLKIPQD